jgi:hypothetical protein
MSDKGPTERQIEILVLLSVSERRILLKLKERRGSFGLFEGAQRIGNQLFHPSTVVSAAEKGLVGGDHVHGYYLTLAGRKCVASARAQPAVVSREDFSGVKSTRGRCQRLSNGAGACQRRLGRCERQASALAARC